VGECRVLQNAAALVVFFAIIKEQFIYIRSRSQSPGGCGDKKGWLVIRLGQDQEREPIVIAAI